MAEIDGYIGGFAHDRCFKNGEELAQIWRGGKKTFDSSLVFNLKMLLLNDLIDTSGLTNNIISLGVTNFDSSGGAIFSGSNAVRVDYNNINIGEGSLSYGCEFNLTSFSTLMGVIGQSVASGLPEFNGRYAVSLSGSILYFTYQNENGYTTDYSLSTSNLSVNEWHKLVVVIDRTNGLMSVYIDNVLKGSVIISISNLALNLTTPFFIGSYANSNGSNPQYYANGKIRKVFVVKRALAENEAKRIFNEL